VSAARYRIEVADAAGAIVAAFESTTERAAIPDDARRRIAAGVAYSWTVTAIDRAGSPIITSPPLRFSVASAAR
jgi:hypothetical protein